MYPCEADVRLCDVLKTGSEVRQGGVMVCCTGVCTPHLAPTHIPVPTAAGAAASLVCVGG